MAKILTGDDGPYLRYRQTAEGVHYRVMICGRFAACCWTGLPAGAGRRRGRVDRIGSYTFLGVSVKQLPCWVTGIAQLAGFSAAEAAQGSRRARAEDAQPLPRAAELIIQIQVDSSLIDGFQQIRHRLQMLLPQRREGAQ